MISVLLSVYINDNLTDFKKALESVYLNQIYKPSELVIVFDGSVLESIEQYIKSPIELYSKKIQIIDYDQKKDYKQFYTDEKMAIENTKKTKIENVVIESYTTYKCRIRKSIKSRITKMQI